MPSTIANVTSFAEDGFGNLYILDFTGGDFFKIVPVPEPTLLLGLAVVFAAMRRKTAA